MPYKNPAQQREYQRKWMARRREEFFVDKSCVDCGATENLELDHRDPEQKEAHRIWGWNEERRLAEIAKCDVRCQECHWARHAQGRRKPHGYKGYRRGCRCDICRLARRRQNVRAYRCRKERMAA